MHISEGINVLGIEINKCKGPGIRAFLITSEKRQEVPSAWSGVRAILIGDKAEELKNMGWGGDTDQTGPCRSLSALY